MHVFSAEGVSTSDFCEIESLRPLRNRLATACRGSILNKDLSASAH
jgi:hypothetical protein